jgi:hypothetical protein
MTQSLPDGFIFMKVGDHAGESFEEILYRKRREIEVAGRSFWGYGGTTLHPIHSVQPFARLRVKEAGGVYLVMEPMQSKAMPSVLPAQEFSVDAIKWEPIPDGISVTGSRYALVLDEIQAGDLVFPTNEYEVAIGRSQGREASQYLRGHVDKGCFVRRRGVIVTTPGDSSQRKIGFTAKLADPYAVLLR